MSRKKFKLSRFFPKTRPSAPPDPAMTAFPAGKDLQDLFHRAALQGDANTVEQLLNSSDIPVDTRDTDGRTALHWAATANTETVNVLIELGADTNARDNEGRAPLHWAAEEGETDIVRLLLRNEADPLARDKSGKTPADWSVIGGPAGAEAGQVIRETICFRHAKRLRKFMKR